MQIAAISDIHGNLPALQAVLADIDRQGIAQIINCGDTLGGPLASARTADVLMQRGIPMIAGNHERQLLTLPPDKLNRSDACTANEITAEHRNWLASAPPTLWLADGVFVCHGTPNSDLHYWLETVTDDFGQNGSVGIRAATQAEVQERLGTGSHANKASLILCGHTHVPRVVTVAASHMPVTASPAPASSVHAGRPITIVNPGSVGLPAYDDAHPFVHYVETGSNHARYAVMERTANGWQVELKSVPYDFEPMAQMAETRSRPDWAIALRTGRMV